jgi:hypothetical protein
MDEDLREESKEVFYDEHHHIRKKWKARLAVSGVMLILAFISLVLVDIHSKAYWYFCQALAVIYAILSLWLFWYLSRGEKQFTRSTIWHQILHWVGLLVALYLVNVFVRSGILNTLTAGVVTITLLALTIYLAGLYSDVIFVLIGITLAICAYVLAYVQTYLSLIIIPVIVVAAFIIFIVVHRDRRKAERD